MSKPIEDYAFIGNCETGALVARDGSIDWLCMPRFDSGACFAALLGRPENGHWQIAPRAAEAQTTRRYRGDSTILETTFETGAGACCLIDLLARRDGACELVRIVRGLRGRLALRTRLLVRFDYGAVVPWAARQEDGRLAFTAGPDRLLLDAAVRLDNENLQTFGDFEVAAGQELAFTLTWTPSFHPCPPRRPAAEVLENVTQRWAAWAASGEALAGRVLPDAVRRSLVTLKGLTHHATGGIVAAVTTSLPEHLGGPRNWDYRYCWLRDSIFTLSALSGCGFRGEARNWVAWLQRALAGRTKAPQIMYGVAGENRLPEFELPWLDGYAGSKPVRIGNGAVDQVQLDIYGEVICAMYLGRAAGVLDDPEIWPLERSLLDQLERVWDQPDDGIWEVRGGRRHFTHSKVMAWLAFDSAVRSITEFGLDGPLERWAALRDRIHTQVCEQGFNPRKNAFVQAYGSDALDASLLLMPLFGFLPPEDPRVAGTIAAIERELLHDGLVLRYDTDEGVDGLPPGEGAFLACSFWLADNYLLQGRVAEARILFDRLVSCANDVGLLAEEYDPRARRQLGNFPQAFSHLALINTALHLEDAEQGRPHDRLRRRKKPVMLRAASRG